MPRLTTASTQWSSTSRVLVSLSWSPACVTFPLGCLFGSRSWFALLLCEPDYGRYFQFIYSQPASYLPLVCGWIQQLLAQFYIFISQSTVLYLHRASTAAYFTRPSTSLFDHYSGFVALHSVPPAQSLPPLAFLSLALVPSSPPCHLLSLGYA